MLGFVEAPRKKRPEKPNEESSPWSLFWLGIAIMFGFTSALVPFGAYFPLSLSIWALLFFFLPLFLMGLHLLPRFGYLIFLCIFLSLLSGGVSILFLGDFLGYVTGITSVNNVTPEEAVAHSQVRYLFLRDFEIHKEEGGAFQSPLLLSGSGKRPAYGPLLYFRYAPIRSKSHPEKALPLFALCFSQDPHGCQWEKKGHGGTILRESLWEKEKSQFQGSIPPEDSVFLVWRPDLPESLLMKGFWSFAALILFQVAWAVSVFLPRFD